MTELVRVDPIARQAWQGNRELALPRMQLTLLAYLVAHAGVAVSTRRLLNDVWGLPDPVVSKTVSMHISWLRRSLGDDADAPTYIATVHGQGYRFDPAMVARPDVDPLDTYRLMPHAGPGVRPVVACPHDGCPADLIAGEDFPISTGRVRVLAAAHEVEHLAVGRG